MGTQDSVEGWLRPGVAAALGAAGVLLPAGYISITCGAYQGPFGYMCAGFALMLLAACLAIAGALGAALVSGWEGAGWLLAGAFLGCAGMVVVSVVALGKPVDADGTVELFVICALPLLAGYGIGRGLARLLAL
jgi:hypothetical protein